MRDAVVQLRPGVWAYALAALNFVMSALFLASTVTTWGLFALVLLGRESAENLGADFQFLLVVSPIAMTFFGWCSLDLAFTRFSFGALGIKRSVFGQTSHHPWSSLAKIDQHWAGSVVIRLKNGKLVPIPTLRRGIDKLVDAAKAKGVEVDLRG